VSGLRYVVRGETPRVAIEGKLFAMEREGLIDIDWHTVMNRIVAHHPGLDLCVGDYLSFVCGPPSDASSRPVVEAGDDARMVYSNIVV